MATLLIAVIYLCFISLGLPDSLLGSAWPVMQIDFEVPLSYMGIVTMLISGCTILSSLFADKFTQKFGTWAVTLISILLTAVGLVGFSFSPNFIWLCIFGIPYGLGAGAIDAALNNYIALHYSSRYMSWLHCFWGVGTIISPYIMGFALTRGIGWGNGYRIVAVAQVAIALALAVSLPLWRNKKSAAEEEETQTASLTFLQKLKIGGVPFVLLTFFAYCALEATVMMWSATYLVNARGMDEETAAFFASMFFIGMTVGRFVTGFITDKLGDKRLMRIGAAVILFGIILLFLPFGTPLALVAFVIIGLGCAPIYPAIIHSTPSNFGRENSGAIIGLQMACAYIGSTFMPPVYGILANHIGAWCMPIFLLFFLILYVLLSELLNGYVRRHPHISAS